MKFFGLDLLDNRYPALHGLRVLAIVSVLQFHVTWIYDGEQGIPIDEAFKSASLTVFFGMDLFFVLSGFLIGSILLHSLEAQGSQQVRRFYLRRIFRTFPSYWVVLTILAFITRLTPLQREHLPLEYVYATNFVALDRWSVIMFWAWSLALEEQFYLTVPLLFVVLQKLRSDRTRVILLLSIWICALFVRLFLYYHHGPWTDRGLYSALYFRTYTRFDTLVAGVLLAVVHRRWHGEIGRWLEAPFHRALIALPCLGFLWLLINPWLFGNAYVQIVHVFAWGTITSVMHFGGVTLLLHGDGWIHRLLSAPIFRRIATLGYGVYLVHIPICDHVLVPLARALQAREVSMLVIWPASVAALMLCSLFVAYFMHLFIEKPSLRLRERLAA